MENQGEGLVQANDKQTKIAEKIGHYSPEEVAVIQNSVAKGTTNTELAYFINVCKTVKLNPFIKEIWCYKDKKGNLLVFAGRDGFLSKAQSNPSFNGIRSCEVCENDEFSIDVANNRIKHEFGNDERGKIIGAYAIAFRKGGEPTIEWVDFRVYNKGFNTWKTHPGEMIKKVAEVHALKKGFGISGIQSEYDFDVSNGVANPIDTTKQYTDIEKLKKKVLKALDNYGGDDKEEIREMLRMKEQENEFNIEFGTNVLNQLRDGNS